MMGFSKRFIQGKWIKLWMAIFLFCVCTCTLALAANNSFTHELIDRNELYLALAFEGKNVNIDGSVITMGLGDTMGIDCYSDDSDYSYLVLCGEEEQIKRIKANMNSIPDDHQANNFAIRDITSSAGTEPHLVYDEYSDSIYYLYKAAKEGECRFVLEAYAYPRGVYDAEPVVCFVQKYTVKITDNPPVSLPILTIDAGHINGLVADVTGGQGMNINVTSNTDWQLKVTEGADWITLSRSSGSGNDSFYTTISPNNGSERTGWIELTAPGCETIRIRVTQEGIPLTSAPEWQSESKEIDSLEDAVQLFYQVEDSAQYVLLTYEGYDESEQLIEQYTLGTYKVKKQAMAAVSSHKYEIDTLEGFDKPISKLYLTICDENSNLLSQRSKPFVIYRTDLMDGTAVAGGSLLAPEWASESKNVNSEEDSVGLYYQVDESAQYVKLEYEGYDENDQLIETADDHLGVYPVEKHVMAMVSDHKYKIGNSFSQFSVPASKLYLTVCDAYGNALSPRSEAMVVYRQDLIEAATKPEIFSVVLSCNGADAIVGERFTLTVQTNSKTTKLVAKNNTGTGFKEPDAWSAKQNNDGTITWTRSYTAEDEAKGRYWTVTPYNAAGTKAAAVSSNKIDIDGLEWYTAYYKFDNKGKKVPATNGIIEVDASQVQNIQIYAGDLHPSDNNGQNPYYYKIADTNVLSVANEHSFNMKVGKEGSTDVEIWNKQTNKKVMSVFVKVDRSLAIASADPKEDFQASKAYNVSISFKYEDKFNIVELPSTIKNKADQFVADIQFMGKAASAAFDMVNDVLNELSAGDAKKLAELQYEFLKLYSSELGKVALRQFGININVDIPYFGNVHASGKTQIEAALATATDFSNAWDEFGEVKGPSKEVFTCDDGQGFVVDIGNTGAVKIVEVVVDGKKVNYRSSNSPYSFRIVGSPYILSVGLHDEKIVVGQQAGVVVLELLKNEQTIAQFKVTTANFSDAASNADEMSQILHYLGTSAPQYAFTYCQLSAVEYAYWCMLTKNNTNDNILADEFGKAGFWQDKNGIYHTGTKYCSNCRNFWRGGNKCQECGSVEYYANTDCWQMHCGYTDLYDEVFNIATDMERLKLPFTVGDTEYIIWAWKGDYLNLGAGAELGVYEKTADNNSSFYEINKANSMPMTLKLYYDGKIIIDYDPGEHNPQWWITGFNPDAAYYDCDVNKLTAVYTIQFRNRQLFDAFYSQWRIAPYLGIQFDTQSMLVTLTF